MRWFISDDISHLNEEYIKAIDPTMEKVLILPTKDEILQVLREKKDLLKTAVVSSIYPSQVAPEFEYIFVIKKLHSSDGILNSQQKYFKVSEREMLSQRLGLTITESNLTLQDASGAFELIKWAKLADRYTQKGYVNKPVFLLGVAGAGKSRFVMCYAGEKKVPMIDVDLTKIVESTHPIRSLNDVFEYLSDTNLKCVLRIDEIAGMLVDKRVISRMLTILNDLNTKAGYRLNGILFATENNIRELIQRSNQFFRIGRWGEKFFVHYPAEQSTLEIMRYCNKLYSVGLTEENIHEIFYMSQATYKRFNLDESRSVYAPSEIDYLFERLSVLNKKIDQKLLDEEIRYVIPQYKSAKEGVAQLLGDAEKNYFKII